MVRLPDSPVACIPAPALGPHSLHYEFRKSTYSYLLQNTQEDDVHRDKALS